MNISPTQTPRSVSMALALHLAFGVSAFLGLADLAWLVILWPDRGSDPGSVVAPALTIAVTSFPIVAMLLLGLRLVARRMPGQPVGASLAIATVLIVTAVQWIELLQGLPWMKGWLHHTGAPWILGMLTALAWARMLAYARRLRYLAGLSRITLWLPWAAAAFWIWFWKPQVHSPLWDDLQEPVHVAGVYTLGCGLMLRLSRRIGKATDSPSFERRMAVGFGIYATASLLAIGCWSLLFIDTFDSVGPVSLLILSCSAIWIGVFLALRLRGPVSASLVFGCAAVLGTIPPVLGPAADLAIFKREAGSRARSGHAVSRVILLSVDTLRRDAVSRFNPGGNPTPNLDALAEDCVVFPRAYSASCWTLPSFASIMTALDPVTHGVHGPDSRLPESATTLAERLAAAGWHTGALGINVLLRPYRNLDQGFAEYRFYPAEIPGRSVGVRLARAYFPEAYRTEIDTTLLADQAIAWFEANRERDFFFWLHFYDPHGPYAPPAAYRPNLAIRAGAAYPEVLRELYLGEVRYVDAEIGRVLTRLKEMDLYDDSLIVILSDHGEEFKEHGAMDHGRNLYSITTGVPLMIKLPGGAVGREVDSFVGTQSVAPTIMDLLGVPYNAADMAYPSLAGFCDSAPPEAETPQLLYQHLFSAEEEFHESLILDPWKVIFNHTIHPDAPLIYEIREDPAELRPLDPPPPEEVERFTDLLADRLAEAEALRIKLNLEVESIQMLPSRIEELKNLGYL